MPETLSHQPDSHQPDLPPSADEHRLDRVYEEFGPDVDPQVLRDEAEAADMYASAIFSEYGNNPPQGVPTSESEANRAIKLRSAANLIEQHTP